MFKIHTPFLITVCALSSFTGFAANSAISELDQGSPVANAKAPADPVEKLPALVVLKVDSKTQQIVGMSEFNKDLSPEEAKKVLESATFSTANQTKPTQNELDQASSKDSWHCYWNTSRNFVGFNYYPTIWYGNFNYTYYPAYPAYDYYAYPAYIAPSYSWGSYQYYSYYPRWHRHGRGW